MAKQRFFTESKEQSKIKTDIVSKYFYPWSKIILKNNPDKIAYMDFFCGPGKYDDGTKSTPIFILESALRNNAVTKKLVVIFNDSNKSNIESLKKHVSSIKGIKNLKFKPDYNSTKIGTEIANLMSKKRLIPSFVFLDPWGYKGLSLKLISASFKNWGCDAIFFFNYNRVNMGINNRFMKQNVNELFGVEKAKEIRSLIEDARSPMEREDIILKKLEEAIHEVGGNYFLPFRFKEGRKTKHFLIFVSKHPLAYSIMKKIMAADSLCNPDGVPIYEYNSIKYSTSRQLRMFPEKFPNSLEDLIESLKKDFSQKRLTVKAICDEHQINKPYIERNYKEALKTMEERGLIKCNPPASKRPKRKGVLTIGNNTFVSFF